MASKSKKSMQDINEYLVGQLDALTNADLKGDDLRAEIERSRAVVDVARQIADNTKVQLLAAKVAIAYGLERTGTDNAILSLVDGMEKDD